ncbi:MAG: hypothetical protein QW117_00050 [Candidatus Pacearchaeota archaeon]
MRLIFIILLFLIFGALFISVEKNLSLRDKDMEKLIFFYKEWLFNLRENSKSIIGYVSKLEWLPK